MDHSYFNVVNRRRIGKFWNRDADLSRKRWRGCNDRVFANLRVGGIQGFALPPNCDFHTVGRRIDDRWPVENQGQDSRFSDRVIVVVGVAHRDQLGAMIHGIVSEEHNGTQRLVGEQQVNVAVAVKVMRGRNRFVQYRSGGVAFQPNKVVFGESKRRPVRRRVAQHQNVVMMAFGDGDVIAAIAVKVCGYSGNCVGQADVIDFVHCGANDFQE